MARLSVVIDDELLDRFDEAARPLGGRLPLLRQLMLQAADGHNAGLAAFEQQARPIDVRVRLGPREAEHLICEAAAMGLPRSSWAAALIHRHFMRRPTFSRQAELCLFAAHGELRRMRLELAAMAAAPALAKAPEVQARIEALRDEISRHMRNIRAAVEGNLEYWKTAP